MQCAPRCELAPDRSYAVIWVGRSLMATAVRRFWPTALLYSSAARRQAAIGCLEDTA
jgi:hypothetical protein